MPRRHGSPRSVGWSPRWLDTPGARPRRPWRSTPPPPPNPRRPPPPPPPPGARAPWRCLSSSAHEGRRRRGYLGSEEAFLGVKEKGEGGRIRACHLQLPLPVPLRRLAGAAGQAAEDAIAPDLALPLVHAVRLGVGVVGHQHGHYGAPNRDPVEGERCLAEVDDVPGRAVGRAPEVGQRARAVDARC